eukprot:2795136-Rhodomonas_salina.1
MNSTSGSVSPDSESRSANWELYCVGAQAAVCHKQKRALPSRCKGGTIMLQFDNVTSSFYLQGFAETFFQESSMMKSRSRSDRELGARFRSDEALQLHLKLADLRLGECEELLKLVLCFGHNKRRSSRRFCPFL